MSVNVGFEPSAKQMEYLEIYLELGKKSNIEIAKEIGINDRTIYRWFGNPEFVDWINSKKDEMLKRSLTDRYAVAIRKAKAGDFQFGKLLFEMQGEYIQKSESKVTQVDNGFENLTTEEIIDKFSKELNDYKTRRKSGELGK